MNGTQEEQQAAISERAYLLETWDADRRPIHCTNCRWAVVSGNPENPSVRCAQEHGPKKIDLWRMLRAYKPQCFIPAHKCPDFDSMSDGASWVR